MKYNFISIEGNIGSGKTSLAKKLALDFDSKLILEEFEDNPFLPKFYRNRDQYAFPLELFFMAERYHQLKNKKDKDLFTPLTITDYFFVKSRLFAQNNLKQDELDLFSRLFNIMSSSIPSPDLVIYLYSDINRLQNNIRKRGRSFEQNISDEYLQNIQNIYLDYLKKQTSFPVILLDITKLDFIENHTVYKKIKDLLNHKYNVGVNNVLLA
tara:strand:+ start:2500 stop:3132 length:633 start_codon:yes stop_codon:yes gene_type:complete